MKKFKFSVQNAEQASKFECVNTTEFESLFADSMKKILLEGEQAFTVLENSVNALKTAEEKFLFCYLLGVGLGSLNPVKVNE
jgi:hypothetical protein